MTPILAYVHVSNPYWRSFGIWLPLFLLWIPALILAPIVVPVVILACLIWRVEPWRAFSTFWGLVTALPGTNVDVNSGKNLVHVRII